MSERLVETQVSLMVGRDGLVAVCVVCLRVMLWMVWVTVGGLERLD